MNILSNCTSLPTSPVVETITSSIRFPSERATREQVDDAEEAYQAHIIRTTQSVVENAWSVAEISTTDGVQPRRSESANVEGLYPRISSIPMSLFQYPSLEAMLIRLGEPTIAAMYALQPRVSTAPADNDGDESSWSTEDSDEEDDEEFRNALEERIATRTARGLREFINGTLNDESSTATHKLVRLERPSAIPLDEIPTTDDEACPSCTERKASMVSVGCGHVFYCEYCYKDSMSERYPKCEKLPCPLCRLTDTVYIKLRR